MFLILIFILPVGNCVEIEGEFQYCREMYGALPIDIDSTCQSLSQPKNKTAGDWLEKIHVENETRLMLYVYEKVEQMVAGYGYQCKKSWTQTLYSTNFWGGKYKSTETKTLSLTPEECWTMSMSRLCDNNKMDCIGDECAFEQKVQDKFRWWSDVTINTFSC